MTGPHPPALDFPSLLETTTGEFAAGVAASDLDAPVVACPGWQVRDLVGHLGRIHAWATAILDSGQRQPYVEGPVEADSPQEAAQWYADRADRLCAAVDGVAAGFDDACWNFSRVHQFRGFWPRRQVQETRMHLFDLDTAGARDRTFDPALSADGVQEVFQVFYPRQATRGVPVDLTGPLRVLATDLGMSWLLMPDAEEGAKLTWRGGDEPVAELSGRASDLLRVLWKRPLVDALGIEGDTALMDRYLGSSHTP